MKTERCAVCGRERMVLEEGRYIDGEWVGDQLVPEQFQYKWICSFRCYEQLLQNVEEGK